MLQQIAHSGTDADLIGRNPNDSVSKLQRGDGTLIKRKHLQQTHGFAPIEFNKSSFGKMITLKYDGTKFRPEYCSPQSHRSKNSESSADAKLKQSGTL